LPVTEKDPFGSLTEPLAAIVTALSTGASTAVVAVVSVAVCAWTDGPPNASIANITTTPTERVKKVGLTSSCRDLIFNCVFMYLPFPST
jgi:hypothetical protein